MAPIYSPGGAVTGGVQTGGGDFIGRDYHFIQHYHAASGGTVDTRGLAQRITGYLAWLQGSSQNIELRGIEKAGGAPFVALPLETAYVPLRAQARPRMDQLDGQSPLQRRAKQHEQAETAESQDVALNQVLGLGNQLAILGGPGSGKTTVLLHMAWSLSTSLLKGQAEPAATRLGLKLPPEALPLPLFVPLAAYAHHRRGLTANTPPQEKTLAHYITHHLIRCQAGFTLPDDFFTQLLAEGRDVLLLLDGLDEVADEDERAEVRQAVENLVRGRPAMRVIVTCRTLTYRQGRTALGADFQVIEVQPLQHEAHISPMVRQAYACIHAQDAALSQDRADDLLQGILALEQDRRQRLGEMAEPLVDSPLMVRLLLIVHLNERELPNERADLFNKAINALLQVDYGHDESVINDLKADWKPLREMAQYLAWHMHQQGHDQGREIEEAQLRTILKQDDRHQPRIEQFLHQARQRGSVMEERGGAYRFIHLAFQEFLVARYLHEEIGAEGRGRILAELAAHLDDPWWREPILLLAGYFSTGNSKVARDFIQALAQAGATANARFAAAELAASAALAWRDSGGNVRALCAARIVALLQTPVELAESKPVTRALTGDTLPRLGDPRFDPQRFHLPVGDDLGFIHIPADPAFRIGTRKADQQRVGADKCELNDALTPSPEFLIARYLVTVAQFRAYLLATGRSPGKPDALGDPDSRPVSWVNWQEAMDYCGWLQAQLATTPGLADTLPARRVREQGWRVTLPTELEWEKAARGEAVDWVFTWGNNFDVNRANVVETGINDSSTVGCFAPNDYGLFDMSGNVWEWTRSAWRDKYSDKSGWEDLTDVGEIVLRGGAWGHARVDARCSARFSTAPNICIGLLGFRVVLCPPPVDRR